MSLYEMTNWPLNCEIIFHPSEDSVCACARNSERFDLSPSFVRPSATVRPEIGLIVMATSGRCTLNSIWTAYYWQNLPNFTRGEQRMLRDDVCGLSFRWATDRHTTHWSFAQSPCHTRCLVPLHGVTLTGGSTHWRKDTILHACTER